MSNFSIEETAVLFLVFNRPDLTARAFNLIREVKPRRLYIAADGPRDTVETDNENCRKVREIVSDVDWRCQCFSDFRNYNLGCRVAVTSAISWFFEKESEGVIIEDDCLPHPSFFSFCHHLLPKYREDENVCMISGSNLIPHYDFGASYTFSRLTLLWGWATWRRAWRYYNSDMKGWEDYLQSTDLDYFGTQKNLVFSKLNFEYQYPHLRSWGVQWRYQLLRRNALSVIPKYNLVRNIGFGHPEATRQTKYHKFAEVPVKALSVPLVSPRIVSANNSYDIAALEYFFDQTKLPQDNFGR